MLRRSAAVLATAIPRAAWDPAQHNTNWSDSYSADIAARRHWPAKKWSIGLEPRTPREWLRFSYRNLAYAYNGALRACSTFPEMLVYYKEMKQRGVKVDVDTLNVLLTRAARYEHIQTDDIFLLFDELTSLGARPDISSVETLHTVLEHSASKPFEWREARRRQLVELYNHLAAEEVHRLAPHHVDSLLATQLARIRGNLRQLSSSLSPAVYRRYFAVIDSGEQLLWEVHNFFWEYVAPDHPALDVASLQMRIPFVASVMTRPAAEADAALLVPTDFEDTNVCAVLQAAVERCVDGPFHDHRHVSERRMYLSLLTMLTSSGVLYTADVVAQLMEIVKYSRLDDRRDDDAIRLLRYALRGSSAASDAPYRALWHQVEEVVDARVVGRYLASRSPWTPLRICDDERGAFGAYPTAQLLSGGARAGTQDDDASGETEAAAVQSTSSTAADDLSDGNVNSNRRPQRGGSGGGGAASVELKTAEELMRRWRDVRAVVEKTGVLRLDRVIAEMQQPSSRTTEKRRINKDTNKNSDALATAAAALQAKMEVFTGMAVFLRTAASGQRYGSVEAAIATQAVGGNAVATAAAAAAAGSGNSASDGVTPVANVNGTGTTSLIAEGLSYEVWEAVFRCLQEMHVEMEKFMAQAPAALPLPAQDQEGTSTSEPAAAERRVEPELECWEAMLVTLRCVMDFCVLHRQQRGGAAADAQTLFDDAAALRNKLVEESRTRFDGRMRILWLQEA